MSNALDGRQSLSLLATTLERLGEEPEKARASVNRLPKGLHEDAIDVLANVNHFLDDFDIRLEDESYRRMQEAHLRGLIQSLRENAPREDLMRFTFLSDISTD